jgi:hypothetical protein
LSGSLTRSRNEDYSHDEASSSGSSSSIADSILRTSGGGGGGSATSSAFHSQTASTHTTAAAPTAATATDGDDELPNGEDPDWEVNEMKRVEDALAAEERTIVLAAVSKERDEIHHLVCMHVSLRIISSKN